MLMKIPGIFKQAGSSRCELVKELVPLEAAEPDMCTRSCAGLPQGKKKPFTEADYHRTNSTFRLFCQ
jgi:hypothetical protein